MNEFETALAEKDCEKLLELFDDYIENIEDEDTLREELKRLEEVVIECKDPYDLAHEIAHVYAHLDDAESGIELYKRIAERKKEDPEEYATALYYLADAYEHFGMPEEAIETYEELLKLEEEVLKNEREIALTLANIAVNLDEIGETEKAIELMERARDIFERLSDEKNHLISLLDLAHFRYELGDYNTAEALINEVLKNPRDNEIEINAKLVEAEIWAGREDYGKAFRALRDALLKAVDTNEEIFGLVFDTLVDFIEGLFNEEAYEDIHENIGLFVEVFEDDEGYRTFFEALRELAKFKLGEKNSLEKIYSKIPEEFREFIDELRKPKLNMSL